MAQDFTPPQIIDAHAHLSLRPGAREQLLAAMDLAKIEKVVVVGGGLVTPKELSDGIANGTPHKGGFDNQRLLKVIGDQAHRIFPFYFANPWESTEDYSRIGSQFYGLKLGPAVHGIRLCDPRNLAFVEMAEKFKHTIYLHCLDREGFRVENLVELGQRFPTVSFILGHGGISQVDFRAVDLIRDFENIYFETSGVFTATIKYAAVQLGANRILFGSEYPLQDSRVETTKSECLDFNAETYRAYTRENILRLVGR